MVSHEAGHVAATCRVLQKPFPASQVDFSQHCALRTAVIRTLRHACPRWQTRGRAALLLQCRTRALKLCRLGTGRDRQ